MKHAADILLGIRFGLDLYINLRPVKLYDARLCPLKDRTEKDVDFVVFRENTEGAYVGIGGNFKKGTADEIAVQEEIHTRKGVERIIRAAFEYAVAHGRREVLMADKSNVMRYGHDLWQRVFAEVAAEYPQIETRHMFVDALTMQMVQARPRRFDVIVTNNMFGDIVTDLGAALQGGLGVAARPTSTPGRPRCSSRSTARPPSTPAPARANPIGRDPLGGADARLPRPRRGGAGDRGGRGRRAFRDGQTTPDLGGSLTTSQVGDLLARRGGFAPRWRLDSGGTQSMRPSESDLIYDWNRAGGADLAPGPRAGGAGRRDAARRPAVAVGAHAVDRGQARDPPHDRGRSASSPPTSACPAPGRTWSRDVERLAREIVDQQAAASRPTARPAR